MSMTLWDRSVLGVWQSQPPPEPDTNGTEPTRPEHPSLLASAEAQAITLGEVFAWAGLAIWGGALVAFVVYDFARTYQHHHHPALPHKPGHSDSGRHQDAR
ncbi:hypothetical protein ACFU7D_06175 [Nocardioides sp. NPDC057577]|uniref:hypothetical protein n=1 Tax=Nocardioides sp. NPDC057577 TaxID=3346171 RepID=UPI00366C4692